LVGDLNSLRPDDPIGRPPPGEKKRGDAQDGATRRAIQSILQAGYTDCYRALHPHDPGFTYPSAAPWLRLDYIFSSSQMAPYLKECNVVHGNEASQASDHLPIWAAFN